MSFDALKPLDEVMIGDERWRYFGRSLEGHHALIADIALNDSVPPTVRQHYENARNAWLYAYFAYRLLPVALLALSVACESAVRVRAASEGCPRHASEPLFRLLQHVLSQRWIVDDGFSAAAARGVHWEDQREMLLTMGETDIGAWPGPTDDQDHSRTLLDAIRQLRNALAHGETLVKHNISHEFRAVAEFINQLFPPVGSDKAADA